MIKNFGKYYKVIRTQNPAVVILILLLIVALLIPLIGLAIVGGIGYSVYRMIFPKTKKNIQYQQYDEINDFRQNEGEVHLLDKEGNVIS